MIRVVREDVQGIRVIKALSKTDYEHRRYDGVNKDLVADEKRAGIIMGSVNPLMTLLMNMGIIAVVAMSAGRVANHQSDPETVIAFMQYFTLISMSMMVMSRMFVMFTKSAASANRIEEVLLTEPDLVVVPESECPPANTTAHIIFDRVNFSYLGKLNNLEDISLLSTEQARSELTKIYGVGTKVADCTLLYGMGHINAFPKDVWIKRALEVLFGGNLPIQAQEYAGIVQQYIFHYARKTNLKV
jgi:ABC-type multidrug transport system fused ATPase/permease subunit